MTLIPLEDAKAEVRKVVSEFKTRYDINYRLNSLPSIELEEEPSNSEKPNNSTISKMEQVDEPTEPLPKTINGVRIADAVAWADKWLEDNSVSEMWDMIRTLRDATEWQDEPQTERSE